MDLQLVQHRVLVSGGSRGIGRVIVEYFLAEGTEMAFYARDETGVAEAVDYSGGRVFGISVDITNPQRMRGQVTRSALHLSGIGIAVPNISAPAGGGDLDTWRCAFETDLPGNMGMVTAALPRLKRSEIASVVLISNVSGREVDMFIEPYGMFKAALVHYRKTLASRHAEDGTRVNTMSPGSVYFKDGVWGAIERDSLETFTRCLAANPMGCMARPDEVARVVLFLASPAASFTAGTNLLADDRLTRGVQF